MFIEPNTNVYILKNCPINSTRQHTLWFDNVEQQYNYFVGLQKYELNKLSYQRATRGVMRVRLKQEQLFDCNYLMFQNASFGGKWFYRFIDNVEYINNTTSEIYYQLDEMQTFFFDYELKESFVEREHSRTDVIGENTVPEKMGHGEYITTATSSRIFNEWEIYVFRTEQNPHADTQYIFHAPGLYGGYPISCFWTKCTRGGSFQPVSLEEQLTHLSNIILDYTTEGKADAIVSIFLAPSGLANGKWQYTEYHNFATRTLSKIPRNKKLYTYPYCALTAVSGGEAVELHYELFESDTPNFIMTATFGANPNFLIIPLNYAGYSEDITHAITITGFPLLPWIKDYFQTWVAQNKRSMVYSTVKDVIGIAAGIQGVSVGTSMVNNATEMRNARITYNNTAMRKVATNQTTRGMELQNTSGMAALNSVDNIISRAIDIYQHSIIPDGFIGTAEAGDTACMTNRKGIYTYCRSIKSEYIDILDNFFDVYGYATNRVKVPNRNVRPHWTYTKTVGCNIKGNLPQQYITQICRNYNNGITFWKNGSEVGNYSLDNRV